MVTFDGRAPGTDPDAWTRDPRIRDLHVLRRPAGRTVVVAAHPDDETLGAGGLLAELAAAGRPAEVVVVTDGSASHPGSPTLGGPALADRRAEEVRRAVAILSPDSPVTLLGHPDGAVREARGAVTDDLRRLLTHGEQPGTIVAPWRGDGHRDHRVVGEICAELADELGTRLVEYPLWLWHWADPEDPRVPWVDLRALPLTDRSLVLKHRAVAAHATQVQPLSDHPADAASLHPRFLATFDRDAELYVTTREAPAPDLPSDFFDAGYRRRRDPWRLETRWYERRKRALTLAALPDEHYGSALEIGCSIGTLTEGLALRCDTLLATDVADAALAQAKQRTALLGNVDYVQHDIADGVPAGPFDLVVLSEVAYYLTRPHVRELAEQLEASLTATGTLVACHWRHDVPDYPLTGDDVHRTLVGSMRLTRLVRHEEDDFLLEVWSRDPRSVAARTGLA
ncbi:MAG: bifunctional PIG-L family deacetylase/class I SAM-dependent methyltransferase [Cellulomonas sp.]